MVGNGPTGRILVGNGGNYWSWCDAYGVAWWMGRVLHGGSWWVGW